MNTKRQAGQYNQRFEWLQCTRTSDGTTGDSPKSYVSQGYLWGSASLESANEQTEFGAVRPTVVGTVTLRNWPGVSALDRLVYVQWGDTYLVDGVRRDRENNETILDVHQLVGGA
jgi:head-tail adaptor